MLIGACLVMTALAVQPGTAHPPLSPEHGVNESTFVHLWSGDDDLDNRSATQSAMDALAAGTDVPLDAPPSAVDRWNRGELTDWPAIDPSRSMHPPHTSLEDGTYVRDAFVEIVTIEPSTRAWLAPGRRPLYVAPDGAVLGVVDYRVEVPSDDTTGSNRVYWQLINHRINMTELEVDGRTVGTTSGTNTPVVGFDSLDATPGAVHRLGLRTTIEVELERTVRTRHRQCRRIGGSRACQTSWSQSVSTRVESVTVSDEILVTVYELDVSGARGRYPNGDLGLVVFKNQPWLGYTMSAGEVRGVWRFYSARNASWDTVVSTTSAGSVTEHSPIHPLQVNAYPFEPGPTLSPRRTMTLLEAYGTDVEPPVLPPGVHLDVMTEPYLASYGLVTRVDTTDHDLSSVTAHGLVRGIAVRPDDNRFVDVPINRSELSLSILNVTDETVRVKLSLVDFETGKPIDTRAREGYVELGGERVETNATGMAVRTLTRESGGVPARYVPGRWWVHDSGYVGNATIVEVPGHSGHGLSTLLRIALPISLLLFATLVVDRVTGWGIWPPWRGV